MIAGPVIEKRWAARLLTSSVAAVTFFFGVYVCTNVFLAFLRCLHYRTHYIRDFSTIYRASFSTTQKNPSNLPWKKKKNGPAY